MGRGDKESGKEEAQYVKAQEGTFCIGPNNCDCTSVHASLLLGFPDPGEHREGGWTPFLFLTTPQICGMGDLPLC